MLEALYTVALFYGKTWYNADFCENSKCRNKGVVNCK